MKAIRLLPTVKGRVYWIQAMLYTVIIMLLSAFVFADEQPGEKDEDQIGEQIQIVADKLITNNAEKYAEFIGDVRASQGNLTITSERLRVYYKNNMGKIKSQNGSQELIKRIVASGHVKISSNKYIAESERVEYDLDSKVLVIKGENSTIRSGNNLITGSKITVHRQEEQIIVERSAQKRVKARFYSKDLQKEE